MHALKNFIETDNIQVLGLTETKTKREIKIARFTTYHRPSTMNNARGTALIISNKIPSTRHDLPPNLANLEAIAVNILIANISITIICYYNPPQEALSSLLIEYASQLPNAILMGDFNSRHIDFGDTTTNSNGRKLVNCLTNFPIYRLENRNPTFISHKGQSIIDHIIISETLTPKFNLQCQIGTTVTSPHLPITAQLLLPAPQPPATYTTIDDIKHADWAKYKQYISDNLPPINITRETHEIDRQITLLTDTITAAKELTIPRKHIPKNKRPLPARILNLIKQKRQIYREITRTRNPQLKTHFNRLNAQIRRDINQFREEQWSNTCAKLDYRNGKQYWDKFKLLTGQKTQTTTHLIQNNTFLSTPEDKSNAFAQTLQEIHEISRNPNFNHDFFNQVSEEVQDFRDQPFHPLALLNMHVPDNDEDLTDNISLQEVESRIKHLKNSKAPGPDQIKAILLKNLPPTALQALTNIYNSCLNVSYFPTSWKQASTIMIPKPGKDPHSPLSYRPISLLNISGKIFEKILTNRLTDFLETNNIIPQQQFGFRSQRSTLNPILELHTDSTRFANLKECTIAVFLDIERAFDKVWHDGLIYKLIKLQMNPKFIILLDSFLHNRSCRVKVQNSHSQPVNIRAGVPQGSALSPILYSIYCSDFPITDTPRTKTRMFADDTAFWTSHRDPERATSTIQEALRRYETWANNWRVKPNPLKSQSICMTYPGATSKRHKFTQSRLTLHAEQIPQCKAVRYLGITFSDNCSLIPDLENTLKKIRNRSNLLYLISGRIRGCNPETIKHTYNSYIRPIIDYRATIYATLPNRAKHRLTTCERKILRRAYRLHPRYPSMHVYQRTNAIPISDRLKTLQQNYVKRTLNSNNTIAIENLHTSYKYPTANNRLLHRLPRVPKNKFKHAPTALLETLYPDLPQALQDAVDHTPISLRGR
ncbi:hypothetical protein Zmor_028380 [Zophobas morio]|uniref:Reverse transcriptase domain-containing protein n=2 Tax=Zophobas morio TaxID=2755281 RepID=A0AA38HPV6_9CUCU|nr:hypothetical protein Zmor_028380 [Zophobas morio]